MESFRIERAGPAATGWPLSQVCPPERLRAAPPEPARGEARRWESEDFSYAELSLDGAVDLAVDAVPNRVGFLAVHAGAFTDTTGGRHDTYRAGSAVLVTDCAVPRSGTAREMEATVATFDPVLLGGDALSGTDDTVPAAGPGAAVPEVGRQVSAALDHLRHVVLAGPESDPLSAVTGIRHLAAVLGTALPRPGTPRSETADTETLRRAMRFIEDNAERPIGLSHIAGAALVTPRAVQYAFQRHLDTTPLGYLRQVRVDRAHQELRAADPRNADVTTVAARWGFTHPGRFAAAYRLTYGFPPSSTLRRQPPPDTVD
ncbi:AraC family transcriptional regulator [Streptomyces spiramenti]|uniref:Helix-turn-helix transcriptional regulator n=1 Tax=Streptomyces spiramenti TaxID=2720606 RepID=A0ABX1AJA1_9ACTN|nr:AraC family transcriptional regulator [Streptomyces spiramenti]NJP65175.1 helix-turn-helix transcriptional regulator [Streptomyces spiramenti]